MTEQQRRFAELYAAEPNATRAAEAAGYSRRTAYSQGQRLLKKAEIIAYIRELQEQAACERVLSVNRAKALLSDIALSTETTTQNRIRAVSVLLKSAGAMAPATKGSTKRDDKSSEDEAGNETTVCLPYDGRNGDYNAVEMPDGSIVPLAGYEGENVLIFLRAEQKEG